MKAKTIVPVTVVLVLAAAAATYALSQDRNDAAVVETAAPVATSSAAASPEASTGVTVQVGADGFDPDRITVAAGETITFVATGEFQVDSDPHPVHTSNAELNLPTIQAGQSVRVTVSKPGTFGLHNHLDSSQKATVTVK